MLIYVCFGCGSSLRSCISQYLGVSWLGFTNDEGYIRFPILDNFRRYLGILVKTSIYLWTIFSHGFHGRKAYLPKSSDSWNKSIREGNGRRSCLWGMRLLMIMFLKRMTPFLYGGWSWMINDGGSGEKWVYVFGNLLSNFDDLQLYFLRGLAT